MLLYKVSCSLFICKKTNVFVLIDHRLTASRSAWLWLSTPICQHSSLNLALSSLWWHTLNIPMSHSNHEQSYHQPTHSKQTDSGKRRTMNEDVAHLLDVFMVMLILTPGLVLTLPEIRKGSSLTRKTAKWTEEDCAKTVFSWTTDLEFVHSCLCSPSQSKCVSWRLRRG